MTTFEVSITRSVAPGVRRDNGVTLLEMVLSMAIMAIVFAVLVPQFRNIRVGWDSRAGAAEALQNGRVLVDHLSRSLAQAVRITDVSDSAQSDGYIEFEDNDGSVLRYEILDGYVQFGPSDELCDLAGPVDSMVFTCYDACDLDVPTVDVSSIRVVDIQTTLANAAELGRDQAMRTSVYLRTNPAGVQTIEVRVGHDHDDGEENAGGEVSLENTKMGLGQMRYVGSRFLGVDIPNNAGISKAHVVFQAGDWNDEATSVVIWGEDSDDTTRFAETSHDLSNRSPTTASVAWNDIEPWSKNRFYQTPDLRSIVSEIVSRPGWSSGNSMGIVLESTNPDGKRMINSYDSRSPKASLLYVEYLRGAAEVLP